MSSTIQEITEEEMNSLTQSILTRYGIDFTCYEPKSLRRRIVRVMGLFDLPSVHALWMKFLRDANFVQVFMNEISVGMTSMFRDPTLWKELKRIVNLEYKRKESINIWHSGCSTGEEVYSMGILLKELQLLPIAKRLATDINENAIQEAKTGVYLKLRMIENESNYRKYNPNWDFERYCTPVDGKNVSMDKNLIERVEFHYHNLITDPYRTGFDFIFCRNVMIYFDNQAKKKLLDGFYKSLNPGGYLVIGYFDTLSSLMDNDKFKVTEEETRIFKKN